MAKNGLYANIHAKQERIKHWLWREDAQTR
jgi:hypothetical protein